MRNTTIITLAVLCSGLAAQSNTVAGLDGRLTVIDDLSYWDRRGPAFPGGEVGMSMLNTMCNPGSIDIPWDQAMQENHPKFGFIIARVHNDKIEMINDWSYCKHAFLSINSSFGGCGPCNTSTPGNLLGVGCSDTYGVGNNGSRFWLGPPQEIDPWLGTWEATGSYFDIGDPMQAGYPEPADGNRSLNSGIFDQIEHRVTVQEADLNVAGASSYYGLQLIHQGEAVANRGDNLAHRGMNPNWNGSSWSFNNTAEGQVYGSILDRWTGANVNNAGNGTDDGRFFVASKVTSLGGGNYHYEYAIQNVDNSRAGGAFRIPVPAGASVTNITFGDIDSDAGNDWTGSKIGTEVVFMSTPSNYLEWGTIYNFGFDANVAPGTGSVALDEARVGPGALSVTVPSDVPGGLILASFDTYGQGCEGSAQGASATCPSNNAAGGSLTGQTYQYEYCFRVTNPATIQVTGFDIYTESQVGTIVRDAHIYPDVNGLPGSTPLASTTITVNGSAGFYTATFGAPVPVTGDFYIGYDNSNDGIVPDLSSGTIAQGYYADPGVGNWTPSGFADRPGYVVNCIAAPTFLTPVLGNSGLPQLGATYSITLADALAGTFAAVAHGFSDQAYQGLPLPLTLPGTSCDLLQSTDVLELAITSVTGTASSPLTMPTSTSFVGTELYHQWAVFDNANSVGLVLSNAGRSTIGN